MKQVSLPTVSFLTVKELTGYLHDRLESDDLLRDIWVQGELSNFSRPSSGHLYFTLKDQNASIRCAMWRQYAMRMPMSLGEGQAVEAHGYVDIYEAGGQLQFYVDNLRMAGEGLLYREFLRLKEQLDAEGLFDISRKRSLPPFPRTIGIVTSPTGAALQDILTVMERRYPLVDVILAPTPVQGAEAPAGLVSALQRLFNDQPDLIILARGGGSLEDLWAFNDEEVARTIVKAPVPVITGIGHETDFTIADFVADVRAPTPTAAAEMATPDREELLFDLTQQKSKIARSTRHMLDNFVWQTANARNQLMRASPDRILERQKNQLKELTKTLRMTIQHQNGLARLNLNDLIDQLSMLSPYQTFKRGYALVTETASNNPICHVSQAVNHMPIRIQVSDGSFNAKVTQEK